MKLNEIIHNPMTLDDILQDATPVIGGAGPASGIFKNMVNVPKFVTDNKVDLDYQLGLRYGAKLLAPIVLRVYDKNKSAECTLNDFLALFSNMIEREFANKWTKLYETTVLEYNPIWNVDGTETTTTAAQHTITTDTNHANTVVTSTELGRRSTTRERKEYPYDSDTGKPTESETVTEDPATDTRTDTNPETVADHETNTDQYTVTHERHGNIGVTMTQDLIKKEREVSEFLLYEVVLPDVANFLTIPIY